MRSASLPFAGLAALLVAGCAGPAPTARRGGRPARHALHVEDGARLYARDYGGLRLEADVEVPR